MCRKFLAPRGRPRAASLRWGRAFRSVAGVSMFMCIFAACSAETAETTANQPVSASVENVNNIEFPVADGPTSILLDDFDSHAWRVEETPGGTAAVIHSSPERRTQGSGALHLRTEFAPTPADLNDNVARLNVELSESEDWSGFDIVTIDIFMAENPTGLAEARLYLTNSAGESAETPLILGWRLFQWENYQMTFPLKGNTYEIAAIPDEILSDVAEVGVAITQFSDSGFGTPYDELNFSLDNMRLGGAELWDAFDQTKWIWRGDGSPAGVTHNERFAGSAGSLRSSGQVTGRPVTPLVDTTPVNAVSAQVKGSGNTPVKLALSTATGTQVIESTVPFEAGEDDWVKMIWELPDSITPAEITEVDFQSQSDTAIFFDSLELISDVSKPYDIVVSPLGGRTDIDWRMPVRSAAVAIQVWMTDAESGSRDLVCEVSTDVERGHCRQQEMIGKSTRDAVYTLVPIGTEPEQDEPGTTASASSGQIQVRPPGAEYELWFASSNGALQSIRSLSSGEVLSTGSLNDSLWRLTFLDETTLPSLRANEFSIESTTHRFRFDEESTQLIYEYDEDGRRLTLAIDIIGLDAQRFDLKATITNDTGFAIRTVSLPEQLAFELDGLQRVLFPIQEGMTLLPQFFAEGRSTMMTRPPMFADVLAYEGERGDLSIHMIQDSRYQSEMVLHHPTDEPVFQPNNLGTGGIGDQGFFQLDMVTYIPDGATWQSATVRVSIDRDFREVAADYRVDNGIDAFSDLTQKLGGSEAVEQLSKSPILAIEVFKAVEWQKTAVAQTWNTIRTDWLDRLPDTGVLHLTHWQKGRDWYDNDKDNHKIEDDHPEALPIWWERYGSESEFKQLLTELAGTNFLTMPFTNWTVWNTYDPATLEIPPFEETPAAATKLRGVDYPFIEYNGYMVEPWNQEVRDRNTQMLETYTDVYPQDLMFVDMTGERSWRYITSDDGATASAAAYTQGVVNENLRLSELKPLFTEGVFDRIGNSVTGYAQTLRQKVWNQVLAHMGDEYEHWVAYPFAADVLHDKVAFYQHDLNSEVWAGEEISLATYYSLNGYNYMVDITKHLGEDEEMIWAMDAMQKSVNARTFGQPLLDVGTLDAAAGVQFTTWGQADDPFDITAYFDVEETGQSREFDGYDIAPGGFLARTTKAGVIAGMFSGQFQGAPLSDGVHWITVEEAPDRIDIRHPIGPSTQLRLKRPAAWAVDANIGVSFELADGSVVLANADMLTIDTDDLDVLLPRLVSGQPVRNIIVTSGDQTAQWSVEPLLIESDQPQEPAQDSETSIEVAALDTLRADGQSVGEWRTDNATWTGSACACDLRFALADPDVNPGRAESVPVMLRIGAAQSLTIGVTSISNGARLVVQVQEASGAYESVEAFVITQPGVYTVDLEQIVASAVDNPFTLVFWLEGPDASVEFRSIEIATGDPVAPATGDAVDPANDALWDEQFDKTLENWITENATVQLDAGTLTLQVADKAIGFGKVESVPIEIGEAPMLRIAVNQVDADTAYTVQLQEQFGEYDSFDLLSGVTTSISPELDLSDFVSAVGPNTYRIVIWIIGVGSIKLDNMSLSAQ
jgi:hypothetical protein